MANKALVIDVDERSKLNGVLEKWETIGNMQGFTRDIITPKLDENADKSAIVSGIPTVFARANMFSMALTYTNDSMANASSGMSEYYDELVDEWLGLITCIALDSGKLQIKRVELAYSDEKGIGETSNMYEAKGAFGNMLFERRDLWIEQTKEKGIKNPFINIIKYNNQVVAGTSPECLLFTAPSYIIESDPRYAPEGKFRNPIKHGNVSQKDWLALYAYVKNLIEHLNNEFNVYYQDLPADLKPTYSSISKHLQMWLDEIRKMIEDDVEKAAANPVTGFTSPFSIIFNYSDEMYGANGSISNTKIEGYTAFKAEDLLLPRGNEIARIILSPQAIKNYANLPIQLLAASIKGSPDDEKAYFAVPLSYIGMNIFGSSVSALIGQQSNNEIRSSMTAEYDPSLKDNNLTIYLTITSVENVTRNIISVYSAKSDRVIQDSDILIWPNFISNQWNKYFMYSEMPHGMTTLGFNAVPFVGEQRDGKFLPICDDDNNPVYLTSSEDVLREHDIESKLLVTCDHRVASLEYKYEIYQSNKPFSGVKLLSGIDKEGKEKVAGYLLIRYAQDGSKLPKSLMGKNTIKQNEGKVHLGFDFGSTNSSVAYYYPKDNDNTKGEGLTFTNRRVSLFGADNISQRYLPKDFFFFPKQEIRSNALKSVLTLHDSNRMPLDGKLKDAPVSGGIPCFMSNLPIKSVTSNTIGLDFGNNIEATLINSMKWSDSQEEKDHKTAYLSTVLLMVYAELFDKGLQPTQLNWSYPSTMEGSLVSTHYQLIWNSLGSKDISPILIDNNPVLLTVTDYSKQQRNNKLSNGSDVFDQNNISNTNSANTSTKFTGNPWEIDIAQTATQVQGGPQSFDSSFGQKTDNVQEEIKELNLEPEDPAAKLEFNRINTQYPLTEACASANYTAQSADVRNMLVYCFDVGGSTTDISALFALKNGEPHMIKQNSIRFAAQKVSSATKDLFESFKSVLTSVCNKYDIKLIGFNLGDNRYSESTAPYYFEQMVDILDVNQLKFFYSKIAELCPHLFAVNMYVTGLIMFYAGQLARPLIAAINANIAPGLAKPRGFQPIFEGKGARIFDWLSTRDYPMAEAYFKEMFKAGANLNMDNNYIDLSILQNGRPNTDVKFEVSKGVASPGGSLQIIPEGKTFEIFGENGFKGHGLNGEVYEYDFTTMLTPEWMREIGNYIRQDTPNCECFMKFLGIYYNAVQQILGINMSKEECVRGMKNMNIEQYVTQELPRFKDAMNRYRNNNMPFDYVAPIIIIEGLKFYEKHLLKCFK
jgi:hypothetical protein